MEVPFILDKHVVTQLSVQSCRHSAVDKKSQISSVPLNFNDTIKNLHRQALRNDDINDSCIIDYGTFVCRSVSGVCRVHAS